MEQSQVSREKELELLLSHKKRKGTLADMLPKLPQQKKFFSKTQKNFTFIDLFAGIGGMRLAFEKQGGRCVFSSEIDKDAQITYFCNFGEKPSGDITQIPSESIPEHDVLLAGFPCQAFSVAGYRQGLADERGALFFDILRILKVRKPKAFLLENVKGLTSLQGGEIFHFMITELERLGYKVSWQVLNTKDYGNIPQTRERVYIVGLNRKKVKQPFFSFPQTVLLKKSIKDMLLHGKQDDIFYYDRFDIHRILKKEIKKRDTIYQWRRTYVRENKSQVCPTLTANTGTGGHNVPLILDSYGIRKLTPRECARFQGFPDKFLLPEILSNSHLYKQIGNSVSVPVIERIAKNMVKTLKGRVSTSQDTKMKRQQRLFTEQELVI